MGDTVLLGEGAVLPDVFHSDTIVKDPTLLASSNVYISVEFSEAPLVGSHDLLTSGKLELGTAKSLDNVGGVGILGSHGDDRVTDGDTGSHFHGLTVRTTHTGGQTICAGAGKHLVLTDDVVRVAAGADVVTLLAGGLDQILVASNTGCLQGAGSQLLFLIRDKVGNEREEIDRGSLCTAVKDSDLGIGDTTAEP